MTITVNEIVNPFTDFDPATGWAPNPGKSHVAISVTFQNASASEKAAPLVRAFTSAGTEQYGKSLPAAELPLDLQGTVAPGATATGNYYLWEIPKNEQVDRVDLATGSIFFEFTA